jgi:hypothetical protein
MIDALHQLFGPLFVALAHKEARNSTRKALKKHQKDLEYSEKEIKALYHRIDWLKKQIVNEQSALNDLNSGVIYRTAGKCNQLHAAKQWT